MGRFYYKRIVLLFLLLIGYNSYSQSTIFTVELGTGYSQINTMSSQGTSVSKECFWGNFSKNREYYMLLRIPYIKGISFNIGYSSISSSIRKPLLEPNSIYKNSNGELSTFSIGASFIPYRLKIRDNYLLSAYTELDYSQGVGTANLEYGFTKYGEMWMLDPSDRKYKYSQSLYGGVARAGLLFEIPKYYAGIRVGLCESIYMLEQKYQIADKSISNFQFELGLMFSLYKKEKVKEEP